MAKGFSSPIRAASLMIVGGVAMVVAVGQTWFDVTEFGESYRFTGNDLSWG